MNPFTRRRQRQQAKQAHTAEVAELALEARSKAMDALWVTTDEHHQHALSTAVDELEDALRLMQPRLPHRPDLARLIDQTI